MSALTFPSRSDEAWRYVDTSVLGKHPLEPSAEQPDVDLSSIDGISATLVMGPGGKIKEQSLPHGVALSSLDSAHGDSDFAPLVEASRGRDWFANRHGEDPSSLLSIHGSPETFGLDLVSHGAGQENRHSVMVDVNRGAEATLVVRSMGGVGAVLANVELGFRVQAGASLKVVVLAEGGTDNLHLICSNSSVHRDGRLSIQCLSGEASLVRHRLWAELLEENSEIFMGGVSALGGKENVHHLVELHHRVAHCRSRQLFKSVLGDESRGSFDGTIEVHPGADDTDADQLNRFLVLGDGVRASAKPQLKIHADEVSCTHGATVGQLEDEEFFYLASRGIDLNTARALLVRGFVEEALEETPVEQAAEHWRRHHLAKRFPTP